jgi:hypothetical protein
VQSAVGTHSPNGCDLTCVTSLLRCDLTCATLLLRCDLTCVTPLLRCDLQVPVMFIQCKGPEARTAASISVSRQREALNSTDEGPDSTSNSNSRPTDNSSSGSSGGYSYFNAAEAAVVVDTLQQLLGAGMQPQDLCVITPYRCVAVGWPGCLPTVLKSLHSSKFVYSRAGLSSTGLQRQDMCVVSIAFE